MVAALLAIVVLVGLVVWGMMSSDGKSKAARKMSKECTECDRNISKSAERCKYCGSGEQ